jgi:selenocysteine lyase/cysteine desulfurase
MSATWVAMFQMYTIMSACSCPRQRKPLEQNAAQLVFVSTRGAALRITPHLYNDSADLEKFEAALFNCFKRPAAP